MKAIQLSQREVGLFSPVALYHLRERLEVSKVMSNQITKHWKKPFGWIFAIYFLTSEVFSQIQEVQNGHVLITIFKQIYSQNKPAAGNSANIT